MKPSSVRWPAEWEPHTATWLSWPHNKEDWPGKFAPIPWVYVEIVRALHTHERVEILCHSAAVKRSAESALKAHGVDLARVGRHIVPSDRVWTRDSGPTGVLDSGGALQWAGWRFNGWAKYKNFKEDVKVGAAIAKLSGAPLTAAVRDDTGKPLVLEGGGIETDGAGTMLVTEEWLLSKVQVRNPGMDRAGVRARVRAVAGHQAHGLAG